MRPYSVCFLKLGLLACIATCVAYAEEPTPPPDTEGLARPCTDVEPADDEVAKVAGYVKELASEKFEERDAARQKIIEAFKPLTVGRVNYWEAWLAGQRQTAANDLVLREMLEKVTPLETLELGESGTKLSYYVNPKGEYVLHGPQLLFANPAYFNTCTLKHGLLDGTLERCLLETPHGRPHVYYKADFREGKLEGPEIYYHPNGKVRLSGQNKAGFADGVFIFFSKAGDELGRYEMHAGTGTRKEWHDNGKLAEEEELTQGLRSGRWETWDSKGHRLVLQTFRARPETKDSIAHGKWEEWHEEEEKLEKAIDLEVRDGVPWEGRAVVNYDIEANYWMYFHEGVLFRGPLVGAEDKPQKKLGNTSAVVEIFGNGRYGDELEVKGGRIVSGTFGITRMEAGKAQGYQPHSAPDWISTELKKLLKDGLAKKEKDAQEEK